MKVKMSTLLLMLLTCLCTSPAGAIVTVKTYQEAKKNNSFTTYLQGVGEGFSWANVSLKIDRNQDPLFCAPSKLAFTRENYLQILDRYISENYSGGASEDVPVELVLLQALREAFPCK